MLKDQVKSTKFKEEKMEIEIFKTLVNSQKGKKIS